MAKATKEAKTAKNAKEAAAEQAKAQKKETKSVKGVADPKAVKATKKTDKAAVKGAFEVSDGIPDSKYRTFGDRNLNSFVSAMLATPGIMQGKIIELQGKSDTGKNGLALMFLAAWQKDGEKAYIIDLENSTTKEFAAKRGLDTDKVLIAKAKNGEAGFEAVKFIINQKGGTVGLFDSTGNIVPQSRIDGNNDQAAVARITSQYMPQVEQWVNETGGNLVMISQIKEKPGVSFGNPEYSTGGSAVGFHSRVRLHLTKVETRRDEETKQQLGYALKIVVGKNHTGAKRSRPFYLIVNNLFDPLLAETAVRWAKEFKLTDEKDRTICGIPVKGAWGEKSMVEAIRGKEYAVFEECDAIMRAKEDANVVDFEGQDDTSVQAIDEKSNSATDALEDDGSAAI